MISISDLGFFGNIWVKQHSLPFKGDEGVEHVHKHDHVTLLVRGEVVVKTDQAEPKKFSAPTFIVIRKGVSHKFTADSDDVLYYCVFALRDVDGSVVEIYEGRHDPLSAT